MAPRETENNAYANFWGDKQRALWYVTVFSGVVNYLPASRRGLQRSTVSFALGFRDFIIYIASIEIHVYWF